MASGAESHNVPHLKYPPTDVASLTDLLANAETRSELDYWLMVAAFGRWYVAAVTEIEHRRYASIAEHLEPYRIEFVELDQWLDEFDPVVGGERLSDADQQALPADSPL